MKNNLDLPVLWKKYKDVVGRIVTATRTPISHKYTITAKLFDSYGHTVSFFSISFNNREACKKELNRRFKRETREKLLRDNRRRTF